MLQNKKMRSSHQSFLREQQYNSSSINSSSAPSLGRVPKFSSHVTAIRDATRGYIPPLSRYIAALNSM